MAIEIEPDSAGHNDFWSLFLRRNGNEGWCSSKEHPLLVNQMRLLIPIPPKSNPVGAQIVKGSEFGANFNEGCPEFRFVRNAGVLVTVHFPEAAAQSGPMVEGDLYIHWIPKAGETINPYSIDEKIPQPESLHELNPIERFNISEKTTYFESRKVHIADFQKKRPPVQTVCKPVGKGPLPLTKIEPKAIPITVHGVESKEISDYYTLMLLDLEQAAPEKMKEMEKP
jgi:hypothetical protein